MPINQYDSVVTRSSPKVKVLLGQGIVNNPFFSAGGKRSTMKKVVQRIMRAGRGP